MPSELKRGAVRVLSNYTRLFVIVFLGIISVPIIIMGVGDDAFGLIGLLGSTIGIAEMFKSIVRDSMNRELGAAYHDADPEEFLRTYNSTLVITSCLAIVAAGLYTGLYFLLPLFNISSDLLPAARWLLVMQGTLSILTVILGAQYNMYMVTERLILVNTWKVAFKSMDFIAAIILFVYIGMRDPSTGLIAFAVCSSGGRMLVVLFAAGLMVHMERRLIPIFSYVQWATIKRVFGTAGWNTAALTASNLHIPLNNVIMNLAFGLAHNAAFTLAVRLTAYVRIFAFANTFGLDVVSARLSTKESIGRVVDMMHHATRIHAMVALPGGMVVLLLASPLINLWVGRTAEPETMVMAISLAQLLVIGMTARGISDCWARMLYGAGFIRAYAPLILFGGLLNPLLAVTLIWALPDTISFVGPALSFAGIIMLFHFVMIPIIAARCLEVSLRSIVSPILRPALATLLASPLLLIPRLAGDPDSIVLLFVALILFGGVMALLGWYYVLDEEDRTRVGGAIMRRLNKGKRKREEREAEMLESSIE